MWMQGQTALADTGFQKCSRAHAVISTTGWCFNAALPEASEITVTLHQLSALSPEYRFMFILLIF